MGGRPRLVNRFTRPTFETQYCFSTGGGGFSLAQPDANDKSDLESQLYYWHITVEVIEVKCPIMPQILPHPAG